MHAVMLFTFSFTVATGYILLTIFKIQQTGQFEIRSISNTVWDVPIGLVHNNSENQSNLYSYQPQSKSQPAWHGKWTILHSQASFTLILF